MLEALEPQAAIISAGSALISAIAVLIRVHNLDDLF